MTPLMLLLEHFEGRRYFVYDDKTGKLLKPGMTLVGHATIGVGRCLDTHGVDDDEIDSLLENDVSMVVKQLSRYTWYQNLDSVRQDCIAAMAFQVGVVGVLMFHDMIAALAIKNYETAGRAMMESKWAIQTPSRALMMSRMIVSGQYPTI